MRHRSAFHPTCASNDADRRRRLARVADRGSAGNVLARARLHDEIRPRRKISVDRATCSLHVGSIVRVAGDLLSSDADRQRVERANRLLRRERRGSFFVWGEADHHTASYRRRNDIGVADSESITKPEVSSFETGVDHRHVAEDEPGQRRGALDNLQVPFPKNSVRWCRCCV